MTFRLGNAIKIDDVGSGMLLGSMGSVFHRKKKGILLAIVCMLQSTLLYMLEGGRNGWMAVDSVGCSCHFWNFQIRLDMVDL